MKITKILTIALAVLCLFAVVITTVACGNDFASTEWFENTDKTKRGASYQSFTGNKFYAVDFDGAVDIAVEIATAEGEITAEIYLKETPDAPIYSVNVKVDEAGVKTAKVLKDGATTDVTLTDSYTDTVKIPAKGSYVIHLNGVSHGGAFTFDW